jgi:HD-GYP domain-containing protein (c-di-GMP phosphodiesterase class II)
MHTTELLGRIVQGEPCDGRDILSVVRRFMDTFLNDRNIILNLAGSKAPAQSHLYQHPLNVSLLCLNIATALGFNEKQVIEIGTIGLLHDIGMLGVDPAVRLKTGRLTTHELFEIQRHPMLGLHLLEGVARLDQIIALVTYQSHERLNGSGYPRQRKGNLIHPYARIIHCADIYEALSSPRPHRPANAPYRSMEQLVKMVRAGFLDSTVVSGLVRYSSLFAVGSIVELSDHRIAKVIAAHEEAIAKPLLRILSSDTGTLLPLKERYALDLRDPHNSTVHIISSHSAEYLSDIDLMDGF